MSPAESPLPTLHQELHAGREVMSRTMPCVLCDCLLLTYIEWHIVRESSQSFCWMPGMSMTIERSRTMTDQVCSHFSTAFCSSAAFMLLLVWWYGCLLCRCVWLQSKVHCLSAGELGNATGQLCGELKQRHICLCGVNDQLPLQYHSFDEALSILRQITISIAIAEEASL